MGMQVSLSPSLKLNGLFLYIGGVLVVSCVILSAALDSSGVLLPYSITSLA